MMKAMNNITIFQAIQSLLLSVLFFTPFSAMAQPSWISGNQSPPPTVAQTVSPYFSQRLQQREAALSSGDTTSADNMTNIENQLAQQQNNASTAQKPPVAKIDPKELHNTAFSNLVSQSLPMSPREIVTLHNLFNATQRAASTIPGVPPRPVSRMMDVSLSPGSTPPVIRLYAGFISTLVFLDATGAPWPIQAYDLGNPRAFNISWNKKNNMMMIQALTVSTVANLMVKLQGNATPVMLTLVPDQQAIDYRVDLRIPGFGPDAKPATNGDGLPAAGDSLLLNLISGVAPVGSKELEVTGADAQAWLIQKKLYLRTQLNVISPGWITTVNSGDGTHVYELQRTPTVLLSDHGKLISIHLSGF
ncbi:MAG: DotH/IcmK family type IV secretion protein [Legionellales bacterium]|nr:DotH/IcmK family type IV secretion protein [Legionellales bacterium]